MKKMSETFVPGFVVADDVLIDKTVTLQSDQLMDVAQYVVSAHIELITMASIEKCFYSCFVLQVVE